MFIGIFSCFVSTVFHQYFIFICSNVHFIKCCVIKDISVDLSKTSFESIFVARFTMSLYVPCVMYIPTCPAALHM